MFKIARKDAKILREISALEDKLKSSGKKPTEAEVAKINQKESVTYHCQQILTIFDLYKKNRPEVIKPAPEAEQEIREQEVVANTEDDVK